MKYIRTIYGIFTQKEFNSVRDGIRNEKDFVIKQADTIEELCDEIIGIRKSDNRPYLGKLTPCHFEEENGWIGRVENYVCFYGAIWTDKGLIYVAKMNEKGELELL